MRIALLLLALLGCGPGPAEEPQPLPVWDGGSTADGGSTSDGGGTADGGTTETESCGEAWFTNTDGSEVSYTQAFTDGEEVLLDQDGTLSFCSGTWFVVLEVQAEVTVLGLGSGPERTVLSGGDWGTVISVTGEGAAVEVESLTLDRGAARGERNDKAGGGLRCSGGASATLRSVVVSNSQAYDGGGVFGSEGCSLVLEDSRLVDNTTTDDGAGLRIDDGTAVLRRTTLSGNQARDGGGLFAWQSDVTLEEVVFEDNRSTDSQGGAVLHYFGSLEVQDSTFRANSSLQVGGALSLFGDTVLSGVAFEDNSSNQGGAVFVYTADAALSCTGCSFQGNAPDDVALDIGDSYALGASADFTCDGSGCGATR